MASEKDICNDLVTHPRMVWEVAGQENLTAKSAGQLLWIRCVALLQIKPDMLGPELLFPAARHRPG